MPSDDHSGGDGALLTALRERIRRSGPIPVDAYMRACAGDPEHGYWRKQDTIGAAGDFITAPEISQVFGELIGLWCAALWQGLGSPPLLRLIELGPGRGTLMRDALRAARAVPPFLEALRVHLVETSPPLRVLQRQTLSRSQSTWHEAIDDVPEGPAVVIANEFLDALPIRQLVFDGSAWRERVVGLAPDGSLAVATGGPAESPGQADARPAPSTIVELRAGEDDLLARLAARTTPFAALFIDYGPAEEATGDTLQAVRRHAYVDPLAAPGTADLTAHVQFAQLARKARAAGLAADGPITQAQFLGSLGIVERAARLMAANPDLAGGIEAGVQRLLSPTGMGQLFKVMLVRARSLPPPFPFV